MKLEEIMLSEEELQEGKLKSMVIAVLAALSLNAHAISMDAPIEPSSNQGSYIHDADKDGSAGVNGALWQRFCREYADDCKPVSGKSVVPFDVAEIVNDEENGAIRPNKTPDSSGWTKGEKGYGKCVDYSIAKRDALRKKGYGSDAMSLLIIDSGKHMVLLVKTDKGPKILDNLEEEPQPASKYKSRVDDIEVNSKWFAVKQ